IIGLLSYNIIDGAKSKKIRALDKSIAVLPLDDITLNPSQALDYEFIGREITTCLVKVKDYTIKPWEDCRSYRKRNKKYPEIGNDLSVSLLVEWTPYETEENRHLSVDLISVDEAALLWSENFEINGTWSTEICRLSRKISKRITRKLRTYLTPQERALIDEQPVAAQASFAASLGSSYTQDAWKNTVTGNVDRNGEKNELIDSISFNSAVKHFTDAINEDSTFAEAYANRAKAKLWGYKAGFFDRNVLDESREDIERAFQIEQDLPEAHVAMGFYYYYGLREYGLASVSFEKACVMRPNNNEYQFYLSIVYATLGNWREVQVLINKVFESNPQNAFFFNNLGLSFLYLDDFPKAILCQDRAIELMPRWYAPYVNKAYFQIWRGEIAEARATVVQAEENTGKSFFRFLAEIDLYEDKYASAVKHIELANVQEFKDMEERKGAACLLKAKIYKHAGNSQQARENYRLAAEYYSDLITQNPGNYRAHSKLGIAYAGLGEKQLAIESGQKALELGAQKYSATRFPFILYDMAQIYALTGDHVSSLTTLNKLMDVNSLYTLDYIKIDPDMKSLLDDPGSQIVNL
ncbi:MAG: hypothetical protein KAS29_15185, partial [Bacteroidales bacterium]|nr:hypothetical protein [Bacteroidales bacterium]